LFQEESVFRVTMLYVFSSFGVYNMDMFILFWDQFCNETKY